MYGYIVYYEGCQSDVRSGAEETFVVSPGKPLERRRGNVRVLSGDIRSIVVGKSLPEERNSLEQVLSYNPSRLIIEYI